MDRLTVKQRLGLRNLFSGTMLFKAKVPIGRSRAVSSVFHEIEDGSSGEDGELVSEVEVGVVKHPDTVVKSKKRQRVDSDKVQAEEATQDVGNGCYSYFLISILKSGNAAMEICRKSLLLQCLVYISAMTHHFFVVTKWSHARRT